MQSGHSAPSSSMLSISCSSMQSGQGVPAQARRVDSASPAQACRVDPAPPAQACRADSTSLAQACSASLV
jgi:hypothetical protein